MRFYRAVAPKSGGKTYRIFLSHASVDERLARTIRAVLAPLGMEAYLYQDDPQGGRSLADKLKAAVCACDSVIALLTVEGATRPTVHSEIGIARTLGKPLIPFVENGVDAKSLVFLQGLEYVPFDRKQPVLGLSQLQRSVSHFKQKKSQSDFFFWGGVAVLSALAFAGKGEAAK